MFLFLLQQQAPVDSVIYINMDLPHFTYCECASNLQKQTWVLAKQKKKIKTAAILTVVAYIPQPPMTNIAFFFSKVWGSTDH